MSETPKGGFACGEPETDVGLDGFGIGKELPHRFELRCDPTAKRIELIYRDSFLNGSGARVNSDGRTAYEHDLDHIRGRIDACVRAS